MPFQWSDYWTKLATDAAGDNLPDLIQQDYAYIAQFVESDDLLDLTPYIESGALDVSNIADNILETGKSADGKIVALCAGVNAPSLIYNKTLTDSLGIEVPDNMTWAQFAEISAEIYEKSGVRTQYGYGNSENPLTYYIRSKGYSQFFEDDKLAYDDASVMVEYYQRLVDGVNEGWLMDAATLSGLDTTSIEQNPLIYYSDPQYGSWCSASFSNQLSAFQTAAPKGTKLAITCWPSDDPAASNYMKPSQFFSVTTDTKNPDAAVQLLNALMNDVEVNKLLAAERGIPASSVVAEALSPDLSPENQLVVTYLNEVVEKNSSAIFPPLANKTSEVINGPIQEIAEKVLFGEMTAEDAAEELFTRGNEIMGR